MNGWLHSFNIYSDALLAADVSILYQQKSSPIAQVVSSSYGMVVHSNGRLGSLVLGGSSTILFDVSGSTFSQIRYTIVCPRGSLSGFCSVGQRNSSGISTVSCPQPLVWGFGTSSNCTFNLIGTSSVSDGFVFASRVPMTVTLITPSYIRKYRQDLLGFDDSYTLIDATGCAASVAVNFGSRRFIFTARTWSGSSDLDSVSSPVFEILGTAVVEIVSMRAAVPRAVDVAAIEFNGGLYVAFATELMTSTVYVYHSGILASPAVINVNVGQSSFFSALFSSMDFVYVVFCSASRVYSLCYTYNIQGNSSYLIHTISIPLPISDAEVFSVSTGQIFLFLAPRLYLWNGLSRSFALHSDLGGNVSNAKLARVGSNDLLVTFSPDSPITSGATPAGSSAPASTATSVSSSVSNPPQRAYLASQGAMYGTCYMRVGAVEADLTNTQKSYSAIPATGNVDTWNVVFASTLIVSSSNLSVYRYFSKGSNQPLNGVSVNPQYFSNSFGGRWSDADVSMVAGVSSSTRISGTWGGSDANLNALFKLFDQNSKTYLVELGWVLLDESKMFDPTNRNDVEHLTWPFDPTWSTPISGSTVAPYRCYYNVSSPASTPAATANLGLLKFRLFDPVSMDFIQMPYQSGHSLAATSPNDNLLAVWTSGSKLFASIGGFGTSLSLKSFSLSQIANGLADFVGMQTCKPEVGFASLFTLSADSKYVLSWYELAQNGDLKFIQTLQTGGLKMLRCRTFSVHCDTRIVAVACGDGVFVVRFSQDSRSLVSGRPLLAANSTLFSTYLSSITSLNFVSRSGSLPLIIAASYSKGFLCSVGLVLQDSAVDISGVVDFTMDGLVNFFRWISQPSINNELPLLQGSLPSKDVLHTDSYSFSFEDTLYLVTFSRCDILATSKAALYAINNKTKSWISLGTLADSEGACSASFCDGGIGQRVLAVGVNHLNGLNYVQTSHVYKQSLVATTVASGSDVSASFSYFPWVSAFSFSTKGARDVISVNAAQCIFVVIQEGDGSAPGPFPALFLRHVNGIWSSSDSNLYVAKAGPIAISSSALPAPALTELVTTRMSSSSSNSTFFFCVECCCWFDDIWCFGF